MSLSVVIPTMNEESYLPTLLNSIKKQSVQPDEIIVADEHSSDRTRAIAKSFGAKVVDGGMPGPGRNRGAEVATGDLIFFFDADVELRDPDFLKKSLQDFEERHLDIATTWVKPIGGSFIDAFWHEAYNRYTFFVGRVRPHVPGFCILVRRALHEKISGFDESVTFCEDQDYANRAAKVGRFGFLEKKKVQIFVSLRRQVRDGRFSMVSKYILAEFYMLFFGPIRNNLFNYSFGHDQKRDGV